MDLKPTGYFGAAGTGKTHRLLHATKHFGERRGFGPGQTVLGLTFMHGSRRRMAERLATLRENGIGSRVETLDAFALRVVRRFRRHCGLGTGEVRAIVGESRDLDDWVERNGSWIAPLDRIRTEAASLLRVVAIGHTLRASHPIVLIDEAQDCDDTLLDLVQAISTAAFVVCAADPFQALNRHDEVCPIVDWLRDVGCVNELKDPRRTSDQGLLRTADALRTGTRCDGGIPVLGPDGAGFAAVEIQKRVAKGWRGQVALISPAAPEKSKWVARVLRSLEKPKGQNERLRPAPFVWEATGWSSQEALVRSAVAPFETQHPISVSDLESVRDRSGLPLDLQRVYRGVRRRMRLSGRSVTDVEEISDAARSIAHAQRAHGPGDQGTFRRGMTVHGAKNREFDYVFVLWPHTVAGSELAQRKLLYNAITRARKDALVLVQGGAARLVGDSVLSLLVP